MILKKKKKKINMLCLWSHGYSFDLLPHTTTNDFTLLFYTNLCKSYRFTNKRKTRRKKNFPKKLEQVFCHFFPYVFHQ